MNMTENLEAQLDSLRNRYLRLNDIEAKTANIKERVQLMHVVLDQRPTPGGRVSHQHQQVKNTRSETDTLKAKLLRR